MNQPTNLEMKTPEMTRRAHAAWQNHAEPGAVVSVCVNKDPNDALILINDLPVGGVSAFRVEMIAGLGSLMEIAWSMGPFERWTLETIKSADSPDPDRFDGCFQLILKARVFPATGD